MPDPRRDELEPPLEYDPEPDIELCMICDRPFAANGWSRDYCGRCATKLPDCYDCGQAFEPFADERSCAACTRCRTAKHHATNP